MKRIYILLLSSLFAFSSCNFLEVEKLGKSTIDTYFADINSMEPAINGVYNLLFSFYDKYMILYGDIAGDGVQLSATNTDWKKVYDFTSLAADETTPVGYIWKAAFNIIGNVNHIIYYGPLLREDYPYDHALINNTMAQAYFVRALMHFDLCRVYGQNYTYTSDASHLGVPVLTRVPALDERIGRESVKTTYNQIINDLKSALSLFTDSYSKNEYHASPLACKALLARVYLYMNDYENAADYASDVIEAKKLSPRDEYKAMYTSAKVMGTETIFRLNGYDAGSKLRSMYRYDSPEAVPSKNLLELFSEDDIRKELFIHTAKEPVSGEDKNYSNICMKYYCTDDAVDKQLYYNPFILRVSEMYLIRAEAYCSDKKPALAEADLEALMSRASGKEVSVSYNSNEELDRLIMQERQRELCFEGHRLFDITRRHEDLVRDKSTNSPTQTIRYPDYRFILPIPRIELDANDAMTPNPES